MAGMDLTIGGDASGAISALAETQAAIDGVTGKSVEVNISATGGSAAVGTMGDLGKATRGAAAAADGHTRAATESAASLREQEEAAGRANRSMNEYAAATERSRALTGQLAVETERANGQLNESAAAHERAGNAAMTSAQAVRDHTEATQRSVGALGDTAAAWDKALTASKAYGDQRAALGGGRGATEEDAASLRTLGQQYTAARNQLRSAIGDDAFNQQWTSAQLRGSAPAAPATQTAASRDVVPPTAAAQTEALSSAAQQAQRNQWATPQLLQQQQSQQQAAMTAQQAQSAGIMPGLPLDLQAKLRSGQPLNDADSQRLQSQSPQLEQRRQQLDELGYSPETEDRVMDRDRRRADEFARKKELQTDSHAAAMDLARHPSADQMRKIMGQPDLPLGQQGKEAGKGYVDGMAAGANENKGAADEAGTNVGDALHRGAKKKLESSSPSVVAAGLGGDYVAGLAIGVASSGDMLAAGLGSAVDTATAAAQGIASNAGLQLGYVYARSVETGMDSVMKSADFMAAAVPQIPSQQATAALGQLGLLGPSGGGGQIQKALQVDLSNTSAAAQPIQSVVHVHVSLDGQPFDQKIATQIASAFGTYQNQMQYG